MTETHQYQLSGYSATPATVTIQSFDKQERVRRALKGLTRVLGRGDREHLYSGRPHYCPRALQIS